MIYPSLFSVHADCKYYQISWKKNSLILAKCTSNQTPLVVLSFGGKKGKSTSKPTKPKTKSTFKNILKTISIQNTSLELSCSLRCQNIPSSDVFTSVSAKSSHTLISLDALQCCLKRNTVFRVIISILTVYCEIVIN